MYVIFSLPFGSVEISYLLFATSAQPVTVTRKFAYDVHERFAIVARHFRPLIIAELMIDCSVRYIVSADETAKKLSVQELIQSILGKTISIYRFHFKLFFQINNESRD